MNAPATIREQVRRLTAQDFDWVVSLTDHAYPGRVADWQGFARWYAMAIQHKDGLMIRTEHAYQVTFLQHLFYDPEHPVAISLFTASEMEVPWEIMALLNESVSWAAANRADFENRFTGNKDAAPFMNRLAKELGVPLEIDRVYRLRLENG